MRELAIITFVTLDGVMQSPSSPDEDPSDGFTGGGWAADYWGEVMGQVRREAMSVPYDMLFGRRTFEIFAAHFPTAGSDDPESRMMDEATKYVATNTLTSFDWRNTIAIAGDIAAGVANLKQKDGPLIQVHGSGALIQSLLEEDLIDEFRIWTFPVVAGSGRRLFERGAKPRSLSLLKTEPCTNGAVMTIYRRADCPAD